MTIPCPIRVPGQRRLFVEFETTPTAVGPFTNSGPPVSLPVCRRVNLALAHSLLSALGSTVAGTCRAARSSSAPSPITTYVHFRPYRCTTRSKHGSLDEPAAAAADAAVVPPPPPDFPPAAVEPPPPAAE